VRHIWERVAAVALLLSTLGGFAPAAAAQSASLPATVINVVDGDTLDVQLDDGRTERIRQIGIDTPETVDPRTPVQCFGREASAHAHELLDGQSVAIELDPSQAERDIYGRMLAYVWLSNGSDFGEAMIADGFAHEYTYNLPYAHIDAYKAAQAQAIASQAGLWSPATCAGDTSRPADGPVAADQPGATPTPVVVNQPAATPTANLCDAPVNPWNYTYCGGQQIRNPASNLCNVFACIPSFWNQTRGYVMQCRDGLLSHSGGIRGSCSDHGGNWRPLYAT